MNPSSLKLPTSLKLRRTGRRTGKMALLFTLTLVVAGQIYGMEPLYQYCTNVITHSYSYISSFFVTPESELLQELRKDKNNFEQKLNIHTYIQDANIPGNIIVGIYALNSPESGEKQLINGFLPSTIMNKPTNFLRYYYYQKYYDSTQREQYLQKSEFLQKLDEYKETYINGYSAIGAAILAPDVSIESKREFIKQLFDLGFEPTKKDIMLAELEFYDAIPASVKENIILFLQQEDLLPEIKRNIISCLIEQYRAAYWPLPEITSEKK